MQHPLLVIGHRHGIGRAITERLLTLGHSVIGISREAVDYSHPNLESRVHAAADLNSEHLPEFLSGLVFAPGSINLKPFRGLKMVDFQADFQQNALDAVHVLQVAEKALKAGQASVVLFSTVAVSQGMPFHASVAMAKGAVEGLTRSLAAEWAPNVRVNAIAPSLTDTPLASKLLGNEARSHAAAERHPLKKVGRAEDVAEVAILLLSSSWISGEVFGVNGGLGRLRTS
ncbi:MAG: SDR family oxidoreductase [Schleiferiaceae bacterium]|nr:SDR family oxidoreductase [Schleiferiaceae bacterium]